MISPQLTKQYIDIKHAQRQEEPLYMSKRGHISIQGYTIQDLYNHIISIRFNFARSTGQNCIEVLPSSSLSTLTG